MTKAVLEDASSGADTSRTKRTVVADLPHRVPATLYASLMARLDRIGSTAREVAQIGAAIGREFSFELLARTSQRTRSDLGAALDRLVEAGLIFQRGTRPEATYLFKHALVQDAAYSTLLRRPRQELHARIADALLSASDPASVAPEIVARHMQSAERHAEAIVYWRKAGEQAVRRAGNHEAVGHFRRALSLLEAQPEGSERGRTELAVLSQLTPALVSIHGIAAPEVGATAERATELGRRLEASEELAPSIANLWLFHFGNGRPDAAQKVADDLFRIARELDNPEILLEAHHTAWPVQVQRGALTDAIRSVEAASALYDEERHSHLRFLYMGHDPMVCGLGYSSHLHWALGYAARARDAVEQTLRLARRLKHEPTLAVGLWFTTETQMRLGDVESVMSNTAELLELSEQYGIPLQRAIALVYRGWALTSHGKEEGLALSEEGISLLERIGVRVFLPRSYFPLAEAYFIAGRYAEGLKHVENGLSVAPEVSETFAVPGLLQVRGKLLRAMGQRSEDAEASLTQSLELARSLGAKSLELRAATELARLWRDQSKRDEARSLLAPICSRFADGLDEPDVKEARGLLA
jgi:predicted ATPase